MYAHRGGAALRPENTIASFDYGLSVGADGLELDVHLTRDGVVVVHHDHTLDRTTDITGPLSSFTADELARADAGYWFRESDGDVLLRSDATDRTIADPSEFPFRGGGFGIPRLSDILRRYPDVPLIIELKDDLPELARGAVDEIRAAGAVDRVSLGSFGSRALHAAREYEPRIATGASQEETRWALYRSWIRWPLGNPSYREFQVPECAGGMTIISPRFITQAHRSGVLVKVWTVNQRDDMQRLIRWGADGLISDRPDIAVDVVRETRSAC